MPRALRKALKQKQELELQRPASDEEEDEEEEAQGAPNPFDLLNAGDEDKDEAEEDDQLQRDEQEDLDAAIEASLASQSKARRKKKKKKQKSKEVGEEADDSFDAALEAHEEAVAQASASDTTASAPFHLADILSIDVKMLDPGSEMRQFFGSKVVQDEQQERQASMRRNLPRGLVMPTHRGRKSVLVPIDDNWPVQIRGGLEMVSLGEEDGIRTFRFQHPKTYQQQQINFLQAVGTGDPNILLGLLNTAPFHVDTLLQAAEILRHQGNHEESGELLARALYAFDRALHPLFKIAGGMARLPFEIPENRSFYLCIYRHIQSLGRRGLWQTAFEFNKLLYALAPEEDPYAALLSLDYYALKAKRFDYISKLNAAPWDQILDEDTGRPGMCFSLALSKWLQRPKKQADAAWEAEAMRLMQEAAKVWPAIPEALFEAATAQGPVQWQGIATTNLQAMHRDLFVHRHRDIYGIPENIAFLRSALLEQDPPEMVKAEEKSLPQNIRRHILLLDERTLMKYLPRDSTPSLAFDPLRPEDSLPCYYDEFYQLLGGSGGATGLDVAAMPQFIQDMLALIMPRARAGQEANDDIQEAVEAQLAEMQLAGESENEDENEGRMPGGW